MCGVAGIINPGCGTASPDLALKILSRLRNRGSDGTGLLVVGEKGSSLQRWGGDAAAIPAPARNALERSAHDPIHLCLGHVRYATTGTTAQTNIHPAVAMLERGSGRRPVRLSLVMNGEVSFTEPWRAEAARDGIEMGNAQTDSATCAGRILTHYLRSSELPAALVAFYKEAFPLGGFTILGLLEDKERSFFYLRDGLRPLHMTRVGSMLVFASETAHLTGLEHADEPVSIPAGEIGICPLPDCGKSHQSSKDLRFQILDMNRELSGVSSRGLCSFELAYLQHHTSVVEGRTIDSIRNDFGRVLCRAHPPGDGAAVAPVPRSGISAADGYLSEARQGSIAVRTSPAVIRLNGEKPMARSFLGNGNDEIASRLRSKFVLNPASLDEPGGVILIDDSIVRGDVCAWLSSVWQEKGGDDLSIYSAWPPIIAPCYAGIDLHREDLFALRFASVEETLTNPRALEDQMSAGFTHRQFGRIEDLTLRYAPHQEIRAILSEILSGEICTGCFDLRYNYICPANLHAVPDFLVDYAAKNRVEMPVCKKEG